MAENKSNKQYFERALSKSWTKFGHTTRCKNSKTSHVFEGLLLSTAKMSLLFCHLGSAKVLFIRSYRRCFLSYIAFFMVRLKISLLLLLAR